MHSVTEVIFLQMSLFVFNFLYLKLFLSVHSVTFDVSVLELKEDRCSRQDNLFIRKVRL